MRKIPTLFVRDLDARPALVTRDVTPGCEWVLAGEGRPTRKYDGVCFMLDHAGQWWARREVKEGKPRPPGYVELATDPETGKTVGWEPAEQNGFHRFLGEALVVDLPAVDPDIPMPATVEPGTYELCGPKINGNPEGLEEHRLIRHGAEEFPPDTPRTFDDLATWLHERPYEGIVWHTDAGHMVKIKRRDFAKPVTTP